MSFSSGTFSINTTGQPVVTGTVISSTAFNALTADLATGLSTCVLKDGTQTLTANIPMNGYKFTGLTDGSALTDSAIVRQVQYGFGSFLTSVAGTNTVTATATPTPAYTVGQRFTLVPAVTNTGAVTLNISGVGAGAVQLLGAALTGGELQASLPVTVYVTATTPVFEIIQPTQFPDTRALIVGGTDATKKARFEVDGITTGTTRVYTLQDSDDTLVGRATTDTLTNKTLTSPVINTGISGSAIATQAIQQTGTSLTTIVVPGVQHYHASAAKSEIRFNGTGTPSIGYSYNITSIGDDGTGLHTVTIATDHTSGEYSVVASGKATNDTSNEASIVCTGSIAAGSYVLETTNSTGARGDFQVVSAVTFGTLV